MSFFRTYKPGQAKMTRTLTFLFGEALIVWGCRSLVRSLPRFWEDAGLAFNELLHGAPEADAWRLNYLVATDRVSPAFALGVIVLVGASLWWWRFANKPRWAEILIEMETELRKVSWPTPSDAWQSTLVVTGFTALVVVTILVYDLVIKGVIDLFVRA